MSIFEWFGEMNNPKKIGRIVIETPKKEFKPNWKIYLNFIISIILLIGLYFLCLIDTTNFNLRNITIVSILLVFYLIISFKFKPKPNYDNIGLFGTFINHPFRISDNFNRFYVFFEILLLPGRYISSSIINLIYLFKNY